ncbi:MAG: endopeptidase La [Negativicutes bacterium]|nr:endopeptidase La [Negativicutes bacterium]
MGRKMLELPLLPLRGVLVFPSIIMHLDVGRERSIAALEAAMEGDRMIFLASQTEAHSEDPIPEDIYDVGTIAEIKQVLKLPGGTMRVLVEGIARGRITDYLVGNPYLKVAYEEMESIGGLDNESEAQMRMAVQLFEEWAKSSKKIPPETLVSIIMVDEPEKLSDLIAGHLTIKLEDRQTLLETLEVSKRLELLCEYLAQELEILELERKISGRVKKQMEKNQREYYLREQLKAIQKELGNKEEAASESDEYYQKLEDAQLPEDVQEKVLKEIERLEKMPASVAEASVIRNYLDWILSLPWGKETIDLENLSRAEEILNEDHYGLDKVKERILEYLSVRQMTGTMKGPILCLVGPPGVGKTSLGRSVARSLEREFVRMSLGGVRDEAEIRGHRRTYVGALPGRIIQGLKTAGSKNPVFLLDEVDKMSADFRGDPSSALLEVLDPEQNHTFSDHYLEIPFDLSKVFWIVTANSAHQIPRPLLDRMELIQIPGYTEEEKSQIAQKYLIPKQVKEHGLKVSQFKMSKELLPEIIRGYTREAGVRSLDRTMATLCRKAARQIIQEKKKVITVTKKNLESFLGVPRFRKTQSEELPQIGVVTGLAWTEVGGEILPVEVAILPGKGQVSLTGQLGNVMQESARAAITYIRSRAESLGIDPAFAEKNDIHVHVPEGAIPKDGPSAGITMATAIISALTGRPVRSDLAMTGEITLRGRVLPIGGLKEKSLAAHRVGIRTVLLPFDNARDLEDIPVEIKKEMTFIPVSHLDEVLKVALLPAPKKVEKVAPKTAAKPAAKKALGKKKA